MYLLLLPIRLLLLAPLLPPALELRLPVLRVLRMMPPPLLSGPLRLPLTPRPVPPLLLPTGLPPTPGLPLLPRPVLGRLHLPRLRGLVPMARQLLVPTQLPPVMLYLPLQPIRLLRLALPLPPVLELRLRRIRVQRPPLLLQVPGWLLRLMPGRFLIQLLNRLRQMRRKFQPPSQQRGNRRRSRSQGQRRRCNRGDATIVSLALKTFRTRLHLTRTWQAGGTVRGWRKRRRQRRPEQQRRQRRGRRWMQPVPLRINQELTIDTGRSKNAGRDSGWNPRQCKQLQQQLRQQCRRLYTLPHPPLHPTLHPLPQQCRQSQQPRQQGRAQRQWQLQGVTDQKGIKTRKVTVPPRKVVRHNYNGYRHRRP